MKCILCNHPDTKIFYREDKKKYYKCPKCSLIFLDNKNYLSSKDERIRYEQHQNFVDDEKYIQFLSKLFIPLKEKLSNHKEGLDFGCGPGPALAKMFNDAGYIMDIYDPYFFPNETIFSKPYDFISCTEVLEHVFNPEKVIFDLNKILKKDGWLGIMTNFYDENIDFASWYYRIDPTHVAFYSKETLTNIASNMSWTLEFPDKNIVLFKK